MRASRFRWLGRPRRLVALFVAVTLVPTAGLIWLGWTLIRQNDDLAEQQLQRRLDADASVVAADIARDLDVTTGGSLALPPDAHAMVVGLTADRVVSHTGTPMVFAPVAGADEPDASIWHEGEAAETRGETDAAAAAYRQLAQSRDPAVRAGAYLRLGRALRVAGRSEDALRAWAALERDDDVWAIEWPASLQAALATMRELDRRGRTEEQRQIAASVRADLLRGRWHIDRVTFLSAWRDVDGGDAAAAAGDAWLLSSSVERLAEEWRDGRLDGQARGRRIEKSGDRMALLLWRVDQSRLVVLAALPQFLADRWRGGWAERGVIVGLEDAEGLVIDPGAVAGPVGVRTASSSVPWTLRVWSAHPEQDLREIGGPRGLIFLLISLAAFLVLAGAYFVARGVRRELEVARLQSDFVSAVSHEFRTPLTSMSHLVELLRGRPDMDEGRRAKYYDALEQEASRLRRVVDQLLDFGRVDAGAAQYRFEPADPVALVSGVVDRFRESPGARGHAVQFSAVGPASFVRVDAEAFALALNNLLENAAKYSPVDAPIDVLVAHDPPSKRVRVDVRDAGPGIPLTEQAIIFEKFVRGSGAQSSGVRGTGVGLALAREIVRAHDGDITVDSVIGKGSRFTIALPAAEGRP